MITLAQVAGVVGRPVDQLLELDRRPLTLAFLAGTYETVVVRDLTSGDILEATLDVVTGDAADRAQLRRRDREAAGAVGSALSPPLRELVLRHPELTSVHVAVTSAREPGPVRRRAAAREIAALAQRPDVTRIELIEDPDIADRAPR